MPTKRIMSEQKGRVVYLDGEEVEVIEVRASGRVTGDDTGLFDVVRTRNGTETVHLAAVTNDVAKDALAHLVHHLQVSSSPRQTRFSWRSFFLGGAAGAVFATGVFVLVTADLADVLERQFGVRIERVAAAGSFEPRPLGVPAVFVDVPPMPTSPPLVISGVEIPAGTPVELQGDGGANDPTDRSNVQDTMAVLPEEPTEQPSVALPDGSMSGSIDERLQAAEAVAEANAQQTQRQVDEQGVEQSMADIEVLRSALARVESGQAVDPELLALLPNEIAVAVRESGGALSAEETAAVQSGGQVSVTRLPDGALARLRDGDGLPTVTETNSWIGTNGTVILPLPGGGDILAKEDFAAFGLTP